MSQHVLWRLTLLTCLLSGNLLAYPGFDAQARTGAPLPLHNPIARLAAAALTRSPLVAQMIAQATPALVQDYAADLSGVRPVAIGSSAYTIATRSTLQSWPIQQATQYAYERLQAMGLQVSYHNWTAAGLSGRNVVAEKPGTLHSDEIVLIAAHIDDAPNWAVAPGADDNGSGAAGVLAAAAILSRYDFERTLRFALFTGEEQEQLGSKAYAGLVAGQDGGQPVIVAVYNMDAIAWDNRGEPVLELHTRRPENPGYPRDLQIADLFVDVVNAYELGGSLTPVIVADGYLAGDHASFWAHGYPAILASEDMTNDANPYHDTADDTLSNLNATYFTNFVKASVGTAAHLAGPSEPVFQIGKRVGDLAPLAGDRLTYTLYVTNTGGSAAGVVVRDRIPAHTVFAAAANGGALQDGEVTWRDLTVSAGSRLTLTLAVTVSCVLTATAIVNDDYHVRLGPDGTPVTGAPVRVTAQPAQPNAAFTYSSPALVNWPVQFANHSLHTTFYAWYFGDGGTSRAAAPAHAYAALGLYQATLLAGNACASATTSGLVDVEDYGVTVVPSDSYGHGLPGQTLTHRLQFTNTGTLTETYQVTAGAQRWSTTLSAATLGPLPPGSSAPVLAYVTVPPDALAGTRETVAVTAAAGHDPRPLPAAAGSRLITTTDAVYGLQLLPATAGRRGRPGGAAEYILHVENTGNAEDNYAVSLGNSAWAATAPPQVGPLAPGATGALTVSVAIPANALPGATDDVTVTLASLADPTRLAAARLTTGRLFYSWCPVVR